MYYEHEEEDKRSVLQQDCDYVIHYLKEAIEGVKAARALDDISTRKGYLRFNMEVGAIAARLAGLLGWKFIAPDTEKI